MKKIIVSKQLAAAVGLVALSFAAGVYFGPKKVETKEVEKIVYRDRVVESKKKDTVTRTKETQLPDGTKIKETIKDEKSESTKDSQSELRHDKFLERKTESRPDWRIGAVYKPTLPGIQGEVYGVTIERRVIAEIYLGVTAATDRTAGLVVSIGF